MDNSKIVIEKGTVKTTIYKNDLASIDETHDGISFSFKTGMYLYATDTVMPLETKQRIKIAVDNLENVDLVINLSNYATPVTAEMKS